MAFIISRPEMSLIHLARIQLHLSFACGLAILPIAIIHVTSGPSKGPVPIGKIVFPVALVYAAIFVLHGAVPFFLSFFKFTRIFSVRAKHYAIAILLSFFDVSPIGLSVGKVQGIDALRK